jgi:RNA polymerase sigma-B factor
VTVPLPDQRSEAPIPGAEPVEDDIATHEPADPEIVPDPRVESVDIPVVDSTPDAPPVSDNRRRAERTAPLFA